MAPILLGFKYGIGFCGGWFAWQLFWQLVAVGCRALARKADPIGMALAELQEKLRRR